MKSTHPSRKTPSQSLSSGSASTKNQQQRRACSLASYRDFAQEHGGSEDSAEVSDILSRPTNTLLLPFCFKLHEILKQVEECGQEHIMSWQAHGRAFSVLDQKLFVEKIMPKFFKQTKFASFQRQLNLYGFQRISSGIDKGAYYHELFLRGKPFLCRRMSRIRVKGNGVRSASRPEEEPDFYSSLYPPVGLGRLTVTDHAQADPHPHSHTQLVEDVQPTTVHSSGAMTTSTRTPDSLAKLKNDLQKLIDQRQQAVEQLDRKQHRKTKEHQPKYATNTINALPSLMASMESSKNLIWNLPASIQAEEPEQTQTSMAHKARPGPNRIMPVSKIFQANQVEEQHCFQDVIMQHNHSSEQKHQQRSLTVASLMEPEPVGSLLSDGTVSSYEEEDLPLPHRQAHLVDDDDESQDGMFHSVVSSLARMPSHVINEEPRAAPLKLSGSMTDFLQYLMD